MVSKLQEVWSGLVIPDPGSWLFIHPGSRSQKGTGSGSATLQVNNKKITWKDSYVITCSIVRDHLSPGAARDSPRSWSCWNNICIKMSPRWCSIIVMITTPELVFVDLLRNPGIDSQSGGPVRQPSVRPRRLAESVLRNRFLGSINVGTQKKD